MNSILQMLRQRIASHLWEVLSIATRQAEQRNWQLYVVGGAVRDLLLAPHALQLGDIDLVVDGFDHAASGVDIARDLQRIYPEARLQIHKRFQTAALLWHQDPKFDSLWIDIATARTEFYPYPAANPQVEASSIRQDLYRRDFTINALALRLTAPQTGEVLDYFGGLNDLQAKLIRVLHANSFIDDPTRIYRAVRFAIRLGFGIEPQTEAYIRHAIASGIYDRIQVEMDKTPALQTRMRRELKYILEASYWQTALHLLADLEALRCLHPQLELTRSLWQQLRLADRWLKRFDPKQTWEHWQILLEVLLAHLQAAGSRVAQNLQLPADSVDRLQTLHATQAKLQADLPHAQQPSQIVQLLRSFDLPTLILIAVRTNRPVRRAVWQYLTHWATVKPLIDGSDLRAMGYKPNRQFKAMLDRLLSATLDGEVSDRATAADFLAKHFPKSEQA